MFRSRKTTPLLLAALVAGAGFAVSARADDAPQYKLIKEITIGGGGSWDYLKAEPETHRLFVSHQTKIEVIDTETGKVVGSILDTPGVHGFAPVPSLKKGFSSNGQENKVSVVDLDTLKTTEKIATGGNPDAIFYDPKSGEVWTCNGRTNDITAIDAKTSKVLVASIPVGGRPETGVADSEAGTFLVNLEDKNEVGVIDIKTHKLTARWPIAPGTGATGMVIDPVLHRIILGCANSKMVMMDSASGKVVATLDCGQGVDAAAFDPETHLAFASAGGSGNVTIAKVEADNLTLVQTLTTERGAKTMTLDTKTHRIYLSNAKSKTDTTSFKVLEYGLPETAAKP